MSRFRFRDDGPSTSTTVIGVLAGAIAGFALGMYVAQRVGGLEGLKSKFKARRGAGGDVALDGDADGDEFDDIEEDDFEGDEADTELEERVLEAYRNDPILSERAVDIGAIGEGVIELAGWVDTPHEGEHAVTLARGVPGVTTVVNRLSVGTEEDRIEDTARRSAAGEAQFAERHWEGNTIGTGRRRQGTSAELDRHVDPKVELGNRWSGTDEALRQAVDDTGETGARRGVKKSAPKADSVAGPLAD